jgi:hypothetical protein
MPKNIGFRYAEEFKDDAVQLAPPRRIYSPARLRARHRGSDPTQLDQTSRGRLGERGALTTEEREEPKNSTATIELSVDGAATHRVEWQYVDRCSAKLYLSG